MVKSANVNKVTAPPLAVRGIGGSGTRVIARLLIELGYPMGYDLNPEFDNLAFTLLFKRKEILSIPDDEFERLVNIFFAGMITRRTYTGAEIDSIRLAARSHPREWAEPRVEALLARQNIGGSNSSSDHFPHWGWKEPNTHIVVDRLYGFIPGLKYIHVARNGLDMAYSANQRQASLWGKHFLGEETGTPNPRYSLKYWCAVHRRILRIGQTLGGNGNFLFLNFDRLCTPPTTGLRELFKFLGTTPEAKQTETLASMFALPQSMGRYKLHGLDAFDRSDVDFVAEAGFQA